MAANAWMQTPAGYLLVDGKFNVTSFSEVIFNPSLPTHLSHMLLANILGWVTAEMGRQPYLGFHWLVEPLGLKVSRQRMQSRGRKNRSAITAANMAAADSRPKWRRPL